MIGKAIKFMRKEKKLSQEQLAKILDIERTTLSGYETERREISFNMVEKIAKNCGFKLFFESESINFQTKDLERKDV